MTVRKAVIPAAGFGTRFLPATKAQPKEMLPLVDTPIIQYVVEEAIASGIEDILIITGRGKRAIEDHFDRSIELETFLERSHRGGLLTTVRDLGNLANVFFVRQKEQLGLGHAVLQARYHIGDEPFAVLLGDEVFLGERPALSQLIEVYERVGSSVVGIMEVSPDQLQRYGVIKPEAVDGRLYRAADFVEKPAPDEAPSRKAICGRYVLDPAIFDILATLPPGKNGEIQLTDAIRILGKGQPIYACEIDARRYDVGDKLGYLQATVEIALEREDLGEAFRDYLTNLVLARSELHR